MNKDDIYMEQKIEIGPFNLKPGESKEFKIKMPIPEGMTPEEVLEMAKKHDIVVTGTYQDENGKIYHFKERVKHKKKINMLSIINLIIGIGLLIGSIYYIKIGLIAIAIVWIFLAIINLYCVYRFGIKR